MKQVSERQIQKLKKHRAREHMNIFTRLPATYALSRLQAQRLLQRAGNLSIVEWRVLWNLHDEGPMTIRDLADIQRSDHSQLSRALPAMCNKNLVSMTRDELDARRVIVALTQSGRLAYETSAPVMKKRRDAVRNEFSESELTTLIELLDRLELFLKLPIDTILETRPRHD